MPWSPIVDLEFEQVGTEVNPQFANVVSPSEVIVISSFHVEMDNNGGEIQLALPYSMIDPIREQLSAGVQSDANEKDERWMQTLEDGIKDVPMELKGHFTSIDITLRELKSMSPGDIIPFDFPDSFTATIEGIPVFRGSYGVSRGNQALKITETLYQSTQNAKPI